MIGVQSQQRILTIRSGASLTDPPLIGGIGFGRSESPKPEWKQAQKPSAPSATLTPWRIRTLRGVSVSRSHCKSLQRDRSIIRKEADWGQVNA